VRRLALASSLVAAFALSGSPALADDEPPPAEPPPAEQPPPEPPPAPPAATPAAQPGRMRLEIDGGLRNGGRAYVLRGQRVTVRGVVKPYVARQTVRVRISSPRREPTLIRVLVRKGKRGTGEFRVSFRARRAVRYSVLVRHRRTGQQVFFDAATKVNAVIDSAAEGSKGIHVVLLKRGLRALGFPAGHGPVFTGKTAREVMAFRKTNGMARLFAANRSVFRLVFAARGAFRLRHPGAGRHAEFDWSRQVLVLADGARPVAVYHASSGKPSTPTVFGAFRFYMKGPGTNAKGMFMSNYFVRGYAIHGYPEVPVYPASHGCIRVPNADALSIYRWIALGDPMYVYL
jgi:hypothetical protein